MIMCKVSVLMPVYNTNEVFLREAIDSVLNQTFSNFKLIIVNDGSTNNVEDVILSYDDNRIIYHKNPKNLGLPKTRNKLFRLAEGDYCAILDSDDIALPQRLEKQISFMDKHYDVGICGSWIEHFPHKTIDKNAAFPDYISVLTSPSPFANSSVMLRRKLIEKFDLFYNEDFSVAEDYELWSRAIRFTKFANIQEVLVKYREHTNQISDRSNNIIIKKTKDVQDNMLKFLTNNDAVYTLLKSALFEKKHSTKIKVSLLGIPVINIERK